MSEVTSVKLPVKGLTLDVDLSEVQGCECAAGNPLPNFSQEEQWTGRYWLDGRKVYVKTIDFGALPDTTTKSVPHGVANLDLGVSMTGIMYAGPDDFNSLPMPHSNSNRMVAPWVEDGAIHIYCGSDRSNNRAYITIEYTCFDR